MTLSAVDQYRLYRQHPDYWTRGEDGYWNDTRSGRTIPVEHAWAHAMHPDRPLAAFWAGYAVAAETHAAQAKAN